MTCTPEPDSLWIELSTLLDNVLYGDGYHFYRVGKDDWGTWFNLTSNRGPTHQFEYNPVDDTILVAQTFKCRRLSNDELFELRLAQLASTDNT